MSYPHTVIVRLTKEQYKKVKKDKSNIIRSLIDNYDHKTLDTVQG
jgi:hypothetical protein